MLHVPGMPEGVHVSFSPEHLPASASTRPALVGAGTPSKELTALLDAHEMAYGYALYTEAYGLPDLAEHRQAEEEAFRALLHTPLQSDADRAAYAAAVISRQMHSLGDASATERDHPLAVAFRNISFGEHAREPEAMRRLQRLGETETSEDPILSAIEEHRAAFAAWAPLLEVWNDAIMGTPEYVDAEAAAEGPRERERVALEALMSTRPATTAGLWALTAYLPEVLRKVSVETDTEAQAALDALREGALKLGLAPAAAETTQARVEEWVILDTRLINQVRELVAIEAEQTAILEGGSYADAYDAPDWVRLEGHRETILARVIATRAHTMEGLKAKARLYDLESVANLQEPHEQLALSIAADLNGPSPISAEPADPHVALMPALRQAWTWDRACRPILEYARDDSPEGLACRAVTVHCWDTASRIVDLPAPKTLAGLGVLALAMSVWAEGAIGMPENDGYDHERYPDEKRFASAVRAMMSVAGVNPLQGWTGFEFSADSQTLWAAMLKQQGEGSLPAWALAGMTGLDAASEA